MIRIVKLIPMIIVTVATLANKMSAQVPPRFSTILFDDLRGTVPPGWNRDFAGNGELRLAPTDDSGFSLDLSALKVAPRFIGDTSLRPLTFLRSLSDLRENKAVFRELAVDRAIAAYDYSTSESGRFYRHRAYVLAIAVGGDSLYVVTATASQPTSAQAGPFVRQHIASADSLLFSLLHVAK